MKTSTFSLILSGLFPFVLGQVDTAANLAAAGFSADVPEVMTASSTSSKNHSRHPHHTPLMRHTRFPTPTTPSLKPIHTMHTRLPRDEMEAAVAATATPHSKHPKHHGGKKGAKKGGKGHKSTTATAIATPAVVPRDVEADEFEAAAATPTPKHHTKHNKHHGTHTPTPRPLKTWTTMPRVHKPTHALRAVDVDDDAVDAAAVSMPTSFPTSWTGMPYPHVPAHMTLHKGQPAAPAPAAPTTTTHAVKFAPLARAPRAMVFGNRF